MNNSDHDVASAARELYDRVASVVCKAGDSKKSMDNAVSRALGGYSHWRIRACRLGEAGCFSATAFLELEHQVQRFLQRHKERVTQQAASRTLIKASLETPATTDHEPISRDEYRLLERRIAAMELRLQAEPGDA